MKCNCMNCEYINLDNEEYSMFCEGYLRHECMKNEYTDWTYIDDQKNIRCKDWKLKEEQK